MLSIKTIFEALTGRSISMPTQIITDAAFDSRLVIPGSLFVAIPGEHVDGHEFVNEAIERGAVVVLIEQEVSTQCNSFDLRTELDEEAIRTLEVPICLMVDNTVEALQRIASHWRDQLKLRVIGITGSVGKSTTKELTAEVLGRRYRTLRNPGNLNNEIGLPISLLRLTEAHESAVLEMGFYVPGEIALLCRIAKPQVGVITNVSHVHMERAGSLDAIVQGKGELVENLPPAPDGTAILNYDETLVRNMASRTKARVFYYGITPDADLWVNDIEGLGLEGVRFVMHYRGDSVHVKVPLLGRHSVHTALRAAAVGLVEGLTWEEIAGGLQTSQSQLRLLAVQGPGGSLIMDDTYNAAPTSMIAGLNLLAELEGRRIAVLGDMLELGDYEERGHRMVGVRVAGVADELVAVGARARWIAEEAILSGLPKSRVVMLEDKEAAIEYLQGRIGEGDVVLIKGSRGMQMDNIVTALEETA
ncbi:MAG: UDP-N-acetylmuramoyl-tripeptide--D-alanyl-D-alanine ligase [Anaerolineales bacterium]|nr:UDP-N-acetylmuramoyl-tripeptide--D-alanyl-D-alanine ligase [Anaerolineales bacterium]